MPIKKDLKKLMQLTEAASLRKLNTYERQIIAEYLSALSSMKKELAAFYEANYSTQRLQGLINSIEKKLQQSGVKGIQITKNGLEETVKFNYNSVQSNLQAAIGAELSFAVLPDSILNSLVVNNKFSAISWESKGISNINQANIVLRTEISQGIIQGKNYGEVAKIITNRLNVATSDALRIVRTEVHRASTEARILSINDSNLAAQELGYQPISIWNSSFLPATRDSHADLDGQEADENGTWYLAGIPTKGPGLTGYPEHDINCQCYITFDIKDI